MLANLATTGAAIKGIAVALIIQEEGIPEKRRKTAAIQVVPGKVVITE